MKKLLTALLLAAFSLSANAQTEVKLEEITTHLGDSVIVTGKVYGGRYLSRSEDAPTFLNIGGDFPNQLLTLVVWGKDRSQFKVLPEEAFTGRNVKVTGKVELHRGKPQIVLYTEKQIIVE